MFMLLHQPLASRYLIFSLSNDSLRAILGETQTDDEDSAMQMLKLWLFATLLGISQLGRASPGGITLIGNEGCFDGNAAKSQFEKVLVNEHQDGQPPPKVSVAVSKTTTSLNVSLRVLNHKGGLMLSRSYTLSPQDCPEVPALLTLVLDEALKTLPWRHGVRSPSRAALSKEMSLIDFLFSPLQRQRISHRLLQWVLTYSSGATTKSGPLGPYKPDLALVRPRARHGTGIDRTHRSRFID